MPPVDQLLTMPAEEGCRRVALALLEATAAARVRLDDPEDRTALHDFRVALRRLRSWIRTYNGYLHSAVRKRHRRRLRQMSRAAGTCRDGEVHVAWLHDVDESLRSRERAGGEWLLRRMTDHQGEAETAFRTLLTEDFSRTFDALTDGLAVYRHRVDLRDPTPSQSFAEAAAPLVMAEATALGERLAAIQSTQDQAVAHAARLAGKRLRYLLEPIASAVDGGPTLVKRLRHLQDTIGEMHDVHVMAEEVIEAAERAGAEQARRVATALLEGEAADADERRREQARDARPGLLAIAGQLRARGESAFSELQQRWLGKHAGDLTEEAHRIAAELLSPPLSPTPRTTTDAPLADAPPAVTHRDKRSHKADAPTPSHHAPPAADLPLDLPSPTTRSAKSRDGHPSPSAASE
jgi:CHAD domain-containing protein